MLTMQLDVSQNPTLQHSSKQTTTWWTATQQEPSHMQTRMHVHSLHAYCRRMRCGQGTYNKLAYSNIQENNAKPLLITGWYSKHNNTGPLSALIASRVVPQKVERTTTVSTCRSTDTRMLMATA